MRRAIMQTIIGWLIVIVTAFTLWSCDDYDVKYRFQKNYVLLYGAEGNNYAISYDFNNGYYIDVVSPDVYSVAYNNDIIVAKQHLYNYSTYTYKNTLYYYIVPLSKEVSRSPDLNKIGPLTIEEYKIKQKELRIPDNLTVINIPD